MNVLLDASARPVIAHRGGRRLAPENTIEAFRVGLEHGADALEFDVRATADDVAVVLHDPTLDRTTDGHGRVRAHTLAELGGADAGYRFTTDGGRTFPYRGGGLRIPTFEDVVSTFAGTALLVHIKVPEAQRPVREVITRLAAGASAVVASELDAALTAFARTPLPRGATRRETLAFFARATVGRAPSQVPFRAFAVPDRYLGMAVPSAAFVRAARRAGCPTHVWTVNDARAARRLWALGVCGIVTDLPHVIRAARDGGETA